jgi:hypothetical protein
LALTSGGRFSSFGRLAAISSPVSLEVDDLGDVGGVVADPLEVLGDEQQVGAGVDRARVAHHVGEQFAEQAVVVLVDLLVALHTPMRRSTSEAV